MHHYLNAITDTKGNALIGYYVRCVDSTTGLSATLYADISLTPIISVSGVADACKVNADGNADFYIPGGTYNVDIYATDATTFVRRIQNVPMPDDVLTSPTAVSVKDFGATGDGVTDDSAAIQAAIDALGAPGGRVIIPNGLRCLVDSGLTIKPNVSLVGPHEFVGSPQDNTSAPYGSVGGALLLNSSATITLKGGASINGLLIHRNGMTFPASDSSGFAGTAITVGGDDASVTHCMILGFDKAIYSSGFARGRFLDLMLDNNNGIEVTNATDVPKIERCHAWPFATIASYAITPTASKLQRSGTAFYMHDVVDWLQMSNCFAYGYFRGFDFVTIDNASVIGCKADGTWGTSGSDVIAGSRGFSIRGDSSYNRLVGCFSASQEIAYYCDTVAGNYNSIIGSSARNLSIHGFLFGSGDWSVTGGGEDNSLSAGISYTNASSSVSFSQFHFGSGLPTDINTTIAATSDKLRFSTVTYGNIPVGSTPIGGIGTLTSNSVASASPLQIPATGDDFSITGTTGFSAIQKGWAGRQITLFFAGALTVTNGTANADSVRLASGSNFTTAAGSTLTLRHNGTQWFEVARAA